MKRLSRKQSYLAALISNPHMIIGNLLSDRTEPGARSNQTFLPGGKKRIKFKNKKT